MDEEHSSVTPGEVFPSLRNKRTVGVVDFNRNSNDFKTIDHTANWIGNMANLEEHTTSDGNLEGVNSFSADSDHLTEELLFDLELTQRRDGTGVSEESDTESFYTACENVSVDQIDLECEHTTSEDSGFVTRAFKNLRIDSLTKISSSDNTYGMSPSSAMSFSPGSSWKETCSVLDLVNPSSPIYEESEFHFDREKLRRSTSLKADKTPPDTPRRKKVVRFADTLGLDLESVRHILNLDSPPRIPLSATSDLRIPAGLQDDSRKLSCGRYLSSQFPQPGAADNFIQRVHDQKVCLENVMITDMTITGTIRVANISYHKSVKIRYTSNNWITFTDLHTNYVPNSCDGPTDRFSFSIVAPADLIVGNKLSFCICYTAGGQMFWDSNFGQNYVIECYARAYSDSDSTWMHFL